MGVKHHATGFYRSQEGLNSVGMFGTVSSRDAGAEPTRMYSRRVPNMPTLFRPVYQHTNSPITGNLLDRYIARAQNTPNTTATLSAHPDNAQPWWFFSTIQLTENNCFASIDATANQAQTSATTPPLHSYSLNNCLGRKNRLLWRFSHFWPRSPIALKIGLKAAYYFDDSELFKNCSAIPLNSVDVSPIDSDNSSNTTATLSTRKGNAQPWRFFYVCVVDQCAPYA